MSVRRFVGPSVGPSGVIEFKSGKTSVLDTFWAAAPKGRCPVEHRGEPLRMSICPSVRLSPPRGLKAQILARWSISQPVGPNPSLLAQIPAYWPISQPTGPYPSLLAQIPECWPKSQPIGPGLSQLAQIPACWPKFKPVEPNPALSSKFQPVDPNPSLLTQIPVSGPKS